MLTLPESMRSAFKEPLGAVYTDTEALLVAARSIATDQARPLRVITVGDVVTYHLLSADYDPDVAIVDYRTKRETLDPEIEAGLEDGLDDWPTIDIDNPAATIAFDALCAIRTAIDADEPTAILVDGEEDLLTLPAIIAAPIGASIVYGQPDEGMVLVGVTEETKREARELFSQLEGDTSSALDRIESA